MTSAMPGLVALERGMRCRLPPPSRPAPSCSNDSLSVSADVRFHAWPLSRLPLIFRFPWSSVNERIVKVVFTSRPRERIVRVLDLDRTRCRPSGSCHRPGAWRSSLAGLNSVLPSRWIDAPGSMDLELRGRFGSSAPAPTSAGADARPSRPGPSARCRRSAPRTRLSQRRRAFDMIKVPSPGAVIALPPKTSNADSCLRRDCTATTRRVATYQEFLTPAVPSPFKDHPGLPCEFTDDAAGLVNGG